MNARGHYGNAWMGADPGPQAPSSRLGSVLGTVLAVGVVGALGYGVVSMVRAGREFDRELGKLEEHANGPFRRSIAHTRTFRKIGPFR